MSQEKRLKRLGLYHLKDKPEELEIEIKKRLKERDEEVDRWEKLKKKKDK
jgi:hypothetical protein